MIVVTATLLFVLLLFAPMRFRVDVRLVLQELAATVTVKTSSIKVFDETLTLNGRNLQCKGTVSTDVDLTTMDKQSGIEFLKCITIEKFCVSLANNMLNVSMLGMLVQNVLSAVATATLCSLSHCQFYTQVVGTFEKSSVRVAVVASTSVAELSFCLVKQGVKLWKTRASEK